jgi:hypothetical protein
MRTDEREDARPEELDPEIEEAVARAQQRLDEARRKADEACAERDALQKQLETHQFDLAEGIRWTTGSAIAMGAIAGFVASVIVRALLLAGGG